MVTMKCSLVLWLSYVVAANTIEQFQLPLAQPLAPFSNFSQINPFSETLNLLEPRQACYAPNGWCSNSGKCCPPGFQKCCSGGCGDESQGECCANSQCKADMPQCCGNLGCTYATSECCIGGGSCPSPFLCVLYEGQRGCCTDLYCTVYLSDGVTKTRAPASTITATAPAATATIQTAITTTQRQPVVTATPPNTATQVQTSTIINTQFELTVYRTTFYWSYWYYFYTIYYSPATVTTRTVTTVTSTTTITCSATDTYAAQSIFYDLSTALPTPASAERVIPQSPTAGAILIGQCSPTTGAGGVVTSSCDSVTAGGGTSSSVRSVASGALSGGGGFAGSVTGASSTGFATGTTSGGISLRWVPETLFLLVIVCGSLMLYL